MKRNPNDATLRNVRAADKRLDKLEAIVKALVAEKLPKRVAALEKKASKR